MQDWIQLTIDGHEVAVEPGSTILDAARAASVYIPTLCADDDLEPYGACRLCLVEVEGQRRPILPSCTTPVGEGRVVRTSTPLIDKLPDPLRHLQELNRVTTVVDAQALIADPWSWSTDIAPKSAWLGGVPEGPFAGHGHMNLRRLLETGLEPAWQVIDEGTVPWTIRNHRNHFERIHSDYLLATR